MRSAVLRWLVLPVLMVTSVAATLPAEDLERDPPVPGPPETDFPQEAAYPEAAAPRFPIRASFYYAWYPHTFALRTHYRPSLGRYRSRNPAVIRRHIQAMRYAHINVGIASWGGRGRLTDKNLPEVFRATPRGFSWALYYEKEGWGSPSVRELHRDLLYLKRRFAGRRSYLRVAGRFVVFAFGGPGDNCSMVNRWAAANRGVGAYVVLKVGYFNRRRCARQPDAWHQYGGGRYALPLLPYSYSISPGFWHGRRARPSLPRSIVRWRAQVAGMARSRACWQLVTSFNEWIEGTAVESARQWRSRSGFGRYLDVLHRHPRGHTPHRCNRRLT